MLLFNLIILGLALAIGPWFAANLSQPAQAIASAAGVLLLMLSAVTAVTFRLYQKVPANQALVRTGGSGVKVALSGGMMVVPSLHQVIAVSLETMRLKVQCGGEQGLVTRDRRFADLTAEFFVKVEAQPEAVYQAARSLGHRTLRPDALMDLLGERLIGALRSAAGERCFDELQMDRVEFADAVKQIAAADLARDGLTLDSVAISAFAESLVPDAVTT
jgi:uncharacterized membrane protein YqiK